MIPAYYSYCTKSDFLCRPWRFSSEDCYLRNPSPDVLLTRKGPSKTSIPMTGWIAHRDLRVTSPRTSCVRQHARLILSADSRRRPCKAETVLRQCERSAVSAARCVEVTYWSKNCLLFSGSNPSSSAISKASEGVHFSHT